MTLVKICGITNLEDALASVEFGADMLGFNFFERSPRFILPGKAGEIGTRIPKQTKKVGVFVDESIENIVDTAVTSRLDIIQLHGDETQATIAEIEERTKLKIIKVFRVSSTFSSAEVAAYKPWAILLDTLSNQEYGGSGITFDWAVARKAQGSFPKLFLAGGLSSKNISDAIEQVRPFAVDACSRLERSPGKKDLAELKNFIRLAKITGS